MIRGTTPTLKFELPFNTSSITKLNICFSQGDFVIFDKNIGDCTIDENSVSVKLSEAETLRFDHKLKLEIQLRCVVDDELLASNIMIENVGKLLKDGVLK